MGLILPQKVQVTVSFQNRKHYLALGYDLGDSPLIDVDDLPKGSEEPVSIACDFCGTVSSISWKRYKLLRSDVYCCPSCIKGKQKHIDVDGNLTFVDAKYRDKEWLEQEYITKNREANDIALECKVNPRTLRWWIGHFELAHKNGSISKALPSDEIARMYTELKMTTEEIGSQFGVTGNTIAECLRKSNVSIPTRSQLMRVYFYEKGGREKFVEYGQRIENRIRVSCRQRGLSPEDFDGFSTTEQHMVRGSSDYEKWRNDVFIRDNYTCACCGKVGGDLNAHHILNFSSNEDVRLDIYNGITLCVKCHNPKYPNSFHAIYGEKNNTREQLEEYIRNRRAEISA